MPRFSPTSHCFVALALLLALLVLPSSDLRAAEPATRPVPAIERALIISIDGLRPDLLLRADTPNLRALMDRGTYTMWARTTAASITLPSHVSMLTGVTPEAHGIMWNADLPLDRPVYPNAPTLFELAKARGYTTAIAAGKSKFAVVDKPDTIDWKFITASTKTEDPEVTSNAVRLLREHRPNVMFMHLPTTDNVGHAKGWGTPDQIRAIEQADACVGQVVAALDELRLRDATLLIITADHGGAGRTHGPDDPRSRTIPWIVTGPGVRRGFDLTRLGDSNVDTYDTFATTCTLLGIPMPRRASGRFVAQILEVTELLVPDRPPMAPAMTPATVPSTAPATPPATGPTAAKP